MPKHVHLLVSVPQRETLSTAIQALKVGFVRSLQYRAEETGLDKTGVNQTRVNQTGVIQTGVIQTGVNETGVPHVSPLLRDMGERASPASPATVPTSRKEARSGAPPSVILPIQRSRT